LRVLDVSRLLAPNPKEKSMITKLKLATRHLAVAALPLSLAFMSQPQAKALGVSNRTKIPFSFHVGQQLLPAGEYCLTRIFFGNAYSLTNVKSGKTVMVSLPAAVGTRPERLIFKADQHGHSLETAR
jgi:hypothetical protein